MRNVMQFHLMIVLILVGGAAAKLQRLLNVENNMVTAVATVLKASSQPSCSFIIFTDGATSPFRILKAMRDKWSSLREVTVMEVIKNSQNGNKTSALLSQLVGQAQLVRLGSRCVRVVVVSHDPAFLTAFAESSLKGRLLVWATRLLVVTSLTLPKLHALLRTHWIYSMMNSIFLNQEDTSYKLYTYLPYSPDGARVVQLAVWSPRNGLVLLNGLPLFPEKYPNFYEAKVNVTALPWPPYWDEVEDKAPDGSIVKKFSGSDYLALVAISEALNFTVNVVATASWAEAAQRVEERSAFMTPVYHVTLPDRWKRHSFTRVYEFSQLSFCLTKPSLKPRWQSLYYPLTNEVWAILLALLLLMPTFFYMISFRGGNGREVGGNLSFEKVVLEITAVLVGQNLPLRLSTTNSTRLLTAAWLVFAFIIGTAYRGNLTAALTLPKYPLRPETIEQLVRTVDRITMPPVGKIWREFFAASESNVYRKLAELMLVGPATMEGLRMARESNTAVVIDRRYLANLITKLFTQADGSIQFYVGREPIFPGPSAWPIPHDAPFKPQLDRCLADIVEAGLYEKWSEDILMKVRRESQREQMAKQQQQGEKEETESSKSIKALTITHMQGPLMIVFLGLMLAGITFTGEILFIEYKKLTGSSP